jgi:hypothetical protein
MTRDKALKKKLQAEKSLEKMKKIKSEIDG